MSKYDRIIYISFYICCFLFIIFGMCFLVQINNIFGLILSILIVYLYLSFISIPYEKKHSLILEETRNNTCFHILNISFDEYSKLSIDKNERIKKTLNKNGEINEIK